MSTGSFILLEPYHVNSDDEIDSFVRTDVCVVILQCHTIVVK